MQNRDLNTLKIGLEAVNISHTTSPIEKVHKFTDYSALLINALL